MRIYTYGAIFRQSCSSGTGAAADDLVGGQETSEDVAQLATSLVWVLDVLGAQLANNTTNALNHKFSSC